MRFQTIEVSKLLKRFFDSNEEVNILMSIRPKYVEKIFKLEKKFEYRKMIFKKHISKVFVYSSFPVKKIVGYFTIGKIFKGTPKFIWSITYKESGLNFREFLRYSKYREIFALEIQQPFLFSQAIDPFEKIKNFRPPQSFYYLKAQWKV